MIKPVCPHCEVDLLRRQSNGVGQYYCPSCYGFVTDFAAVKTILARQQVPLVWRDVHAAPAGTISCTHCRLKMNVVVQTYSSAQIELDFCPRCKLLWFDTGEWHDLTKVRALQDSGKDVFQSHAKQYADALLQLEDEKLKTSRTFSAEPITDAPYYKIILAFIGLPTEEHADSFHVQPWLTWGLIAFCTFVSIGSFKDLDVLIKTFGHLSSQSFPWYFITPFTSFFLHGSYWHLLSNMYFFWVFGDNVEDHLGKGRYLALLICATLFGDLLFDWLDPRSGVVPGIGASGGIAGLIAFYLCRFPNRRFIVRILFFLRAIPGWLFGGLYFVKELIGAVVQMAGATGVSHLAHLGGAFVGVLFAFYFKQRFEEEA